jgi:hypothetical protein
MNRRVKQCVGRTGEYKMNTPPLRFIFDLLSVANCDVNNCDYATLHRFYLSIRKSISIKGRFIIFSRIELVNFPVFVWQDPLSFAKGSAFDYNSPVVKRGGDAFH